MDYAVVRSSDLESLTIKVIALLLKGWTVQGGICESSNKNPRGDSQSVYLQALIRKD